MVVELQIASSKMGQDAIPLSTHLSVGLIDFSIAINVLCATTCAVEGAEVIFVFGNWLVSNAPDGITWPGYSAKRYADGRTQADYFGNNTLLHSGPFT